MKKMKIGNISIGRDCPPFIIGEMSGNHNRSLDHALRLVRIAAECKVDAIKLQTYTPDTLTIDHSGGLFTIDDESSLWHGKNLYELYDIAHTPWEWHKEIFDLARSLNLEVFSTPFDETAVDFLETLEVPAYKIASFESNHHPLLKKVASTGKPIIISSGTSNIDELLESIDVLKENGCREIIVLKCTSTYPANIKSSNLLTIPTLYDIFDDCLIGLSDHTLGIGASVAAVALGACVIEKHFTSSRDDGGVDSAFSLEPSELSSLVYEAKRAKLSLGRVQLRSQKAEDGSLRFKRSIYAVQDIKEGSAFSNENIRIIRPGDGLQPKHFEEILGKNCKMNIDKGTPLSWDYVE